MQPSLKQSLANLQLDYLDLYLMHWPVSWGFTNPGDVIVDTPIKVRELACFCDHFGGRPFGAQEVGSLYTRLNLVSRPTAV